MFFQNDRLQKFAERYLEKIETVSAYYRGKGWGEATVNHEVRQIDKLLGVRSPKIALDIGGNKGLYTREILNKFPEISVVVFEPAESNIELLKTNFSNPSVKIEPFALSSKTGSAVLHSDKPGSGLASLTKRRLEHHNKEMSVSENIKTLRFEEYWREKMNRATIDFCKIDVEGHELDVLEGFGEAINYTHLFQFEFGGCNIDTRTFFQDFWYFFKENGFEIFRLTPLGNTRLKKYREELESFKISNYVARRLRQ